MSHESLLLLGRMGGMLKVLDEAHVVAMPDWMRAMLLDVLEQYEAFKESKHV